MRIKYCGLASGKDHWEALDSHGKQLWFGAWANCVRICLGLSPIEDAFAITDEDSDYWERVGFSDCMDLMREYNS